ncbi:hypothetical protein KSS87_000048, partial [Heliosperma pusillum]
MFPTFPTLVLTFKSDYIRLSHFLKLYLRYCNKIYTNNLDGGTTFYLIFFTILNENHNRLP